MSEIVKKQTDTVKWKVKVDRRFDELTELACSKTSYTTKAEFIRACVRRRIKELIPDAKL